MNFHSVLCLLQGSEWKKKRKKERKKEKEKKHNKNWALTALCADMQH